MNNDLHCPMIHGGLVIDLKNTKEDKIKISHCCLLSLNQSDAYEITSKDKVWNNLALIPLRNLNNKNQWYEKCVCQYLEASGQESFRSGTLKMFGKEKNLVGPQRLDLMFDIGCNLACRTCGPEASTFWQQHLSKNGIQNYFKVSTKSEVDRMITILSDMDLSRLELVVFCGGETLLGSGYWRVADAIAKLANPKQVTLSFQTNGTQSIDEKYYELIDKFKLVKLNFSLDGTKDQFEYLRWPASWDQVTDNILHLKETLPVNTMFLVEETISIFNLFYQEKLELWLKNNFNTNRLGDKVDHTRHFAAGTFSIDNLTQEYFENLDRNLKKLVPPEWKENNCNIKKMISEIDKFDGIRKQNWKNVFPEVHSFYKKYLNS